MTSSQSIILLCFDYFQWFKPLHFYIVVTLFLATSKILERYSDANLERKSRYKNWRPPRLRAFGSGGRKRNTYEYACLLTRPDCRRTKKKFWLNEFSSFTGRKSGILISIIHEIFWRNLRNKRSQADSTHNFFYVMSLGHLILFVSEVSALLLINILSYIFDFWKRATENEN